MRNKPLLLIARSKDNNIIVKQKLVKWGYDVITLDLVQYQDLDIDFAHSKDYEYVIITSTRSAKIVSSKQFYKKYLVVGKVSGDIVKHYSPKSDIRIFNNVNEIQRYIKLLDCSKIIYFSANIISAKIKKVRRLIIYETKYLETLPREVIRKLQGNNLTYFMIYSRLTLDKLVGLFTSYDILDSIKNASVICISKNVADKAARYFTKVTYTSKPSEEEMLEMLQV